MKLKNIYLVLIILLAIRAKAQQGFGTSNPAPSSVIDMVAGNKGALLPRVTLTNTLDISTVPSPANTLTVFNTATAGTAPNNVTPGYYYWSTSGSKWIRLMTASDTTVSNASSANTATITVNGITSTGAPIINTNTISLTGTNLTTTVNGVVSTALNLQPAITAGTTHTLSNPTNTITSVVNGVSVTAPAVNTVSNSSTVNSLTTIVNGVAGTAVPIVNTNALTLSGTNLTSTVNGIVSTALNLQSAITAGTTHTLSSAVNTITSVVNGVSVTAPAVNLNTLTATNGNLISTVNGVTTTPAVPVLIAADNGLTVTNGKVQLGGSLTGATVITQGANTLTYTGTAASMVKIINIAGTAATPVSALQIVDGSQAAGKVLTSDANGNTSWVTPAIKAISGTLPSGASVVSFTSYGSGTPPNISKYTNGFITLPPGKWMVSFGSLASMGQNDRINTSDTQLWCTAFLSDGTSATDNVTTNDYITAYTGQRGSGGSIGRGMNRTMITGSIAINNTSAANKTYYLWANQELENYTGGPAQIYINGGTTLGTNPGYWINLFGNGNYERYFYAIPIQ